MKLLTAELKTELRKYPLYSQEKKEDQAEIICKFFLPIGSWTWYVVEAEEQPDGDYLFFGLVINNQFEREFGYFTLKELESILIKPFGLKTERDLYFTKCKIQDL